jgi:maltodextrin utilization protein YvdJ
MVMGCVGTVIVLCSIAWYAYYQVIYYSSIKFGVVVYYLISLIVLALMVSAGAYMYKTSKMLKSGIEKKLKEGKDVKDN